MSMTRPIAWLAALAVVCSLNTDASAQGMPIGPGVGTQLSATAGSEHFWNFQPFIDPGYFQPDFQFFAPPEVSDFGGGEAPNHGLYFSFDRTYVAVSRPRDEFSFGSSGQGDFTWGNRIEVGYMLGDPKGWQAVLWHVNGPNEYWTESQYQRRYISSGTTQEQTVRLDVSEKESVNVLKMSSFELNRVWRTEAFHNGSILEPFIGYRYMNVRDFFQREETFEIVGVPPDFEFLVKNTRFANFENQMHGGQLGGRLFRQRGHWLLSVDVRFFAMANFQTLQIVDQQSILPNPEYAEVDNTFVDIIQPIVGNGDVERPMFYRQASQFVFGGEVRGEASYELTRDINLRVGFVFLDLGQGLGRGDGRVNAPNDPIQFNNQAVQMAGVTFGFTVNR